MGKYIAVLTIIVTIISIYFKLPNPELNWKLVENLAYNHSESSRLPTKTKTKTTHPLHGYVVVITGATSGIGKGITSVMYRLGATVIAIGRSSLKLTRLKEELLDENNRDRIITIIADFDNLNDVSKASNVIISKFSHVDFLINNAGFNCQQPSSNKETFVTTQGYNRCFGVNYLSHFLLSEKLIPLLDKSNKYSPRIIQVSSSTHWLSDGTELQIGNNNSPLASQGKNINASFFHQYPSSKLAQILHGRSLSKKLQTSKIKIISICPGLVYTNITSSKQNIQSKLIQMRVKLFGYSSNGYGLSSIINALFRSNIGNEHDKTDFIYNFKSPIANAKWRYNVRLRRNVIKISRLFVPIIQKFIYVDLGIYDSSPESYNATLQNDLYEWSSNAVSQWL